MKVKTQHKNICSDTITPIGTFLNLRDKFDRVSLFESSDYSSRQNSKSFVCAAPIASAEIQNGEIILRQNQLIHQREAVQSAKQIQSVIDLFDFEEKQNSKLNGFFGVVGYNAIPLFEDIELKGNQELEDVLFYLYRYIVVFDNFTNSATLIENSFEENFDLELLEREIFKGKKHHSVFGLTADEESNETDKSMESKIKLAQDNIAAGDVFQLVLSRRFKQPFKGDDFEVYRQLRTLNPSPYMFYFDMGKAIVFGASPEAQFKSTDGLAEIHPIAGTVRRTGDVQADKALAQKLALDAKENAEHAMLVDLARNDLNRSCRDVEVVKLKEIQEFSHVMHMVSVVQGQINDSSPLESFGASFPAGTLSGAPKYRAMELINEYESESRNYYGGAIGHLSADGDVNMAIVIRSCLSKNNVLEFQAGAGVVMDSNPTSEVQEIENKVRVIRTAICRANTES